MEITCRDYSKISQPWHEDDAQLAQNTAGAMSRQRHDWILHRQNCQGPSWGISPLAPTAIPCWQHTVPAIFGQKSIILTLRQYSSICKDNCADRP